MIIEYAIVWIFSSGFAFLLNRIFLQFSDNFGRRLRRKYVTRWANETKPSIGGISFYIIFLITLIVYLLSHTPFELSRALLGIVLAGSLGFVLGLADDAYDTIPLLKLFGQILCGSILVFFGIYIKLTHMYWVDVALTLFWVVGIMNSINMLDNMDGVASIVSVCILLSACILRMLLGVNNDAISFFVMGIIGGLSGFLILNWPSAKIYMGDTGSQFLGIILASLGIHVFWGLEGVVPENHEFLKKILIPLLVFIIPITDTTIVTFSRLARGRSPFRGGKDHITHHLVFAGIREPIVPLLLMVVSLSSSAFAIAAIYNIQNWSFALYASIAVYLLLVFSVILFFYIIGRMNLMQQRNRQSSGQPFDKFPEENIPMKVIK